MANFFLGLNKTFSRRLLIHNLLATSPVKNLHYSMQKLRKGLRKWFYKDIIYIE